MENDATIGTDAGSNQADTTANKSADTSKIASPSTNQVSPAPATAQEIENSQPFSLHDPKRDKQIQKGLEALRAKRETAEGKATDKPADKSETKPAEAKPEKPTAAQIKAEKEARNEAEKQAIKVAADKIPAWMKATLPKGFLGDTTEGESAEGTPETAEAQAKESEAKSEAKYDYHAAHPKLKAGMARSLAIEPGEIRTEQEYIDDLLGVNEILQTGSPDMKARLAAAMIHSFNISPDMINEAFQRYAGQESPTAAYDRAEQNFLVRHLEELIDEHPKEFEGVDKDEFLMYAKNHPGYSKLISTGKYRPALLSALTDYRWNHEPTRSVMLKLIEGFVIEREQAKFAKQLQNTSHKRPSQSSSPSDSYTDEQRTEDIREATRRRAAARNQ